ncbi:GntR family transcriptional regulator [Paracoccus sp. NGMCC 1.201697]|uniref:GntR family transcriptional regulator n=1 Tax=Paracoccus broussonetiae subsp. drimophilus TaxID=3373869 RepID=A0ABW7LIR2_9RHOB
MTDARILQEIKETIDPQSGVPLHVQVRRLIRQKTLDGVLVDDHGRLRTESELGEIFGVSRITVRNALRALVDEGLFSRTRGRGTFLRSPGVENWGGTLTGFVEAGREAGFDPGGEILAQGMTKDFPASVGAALHERALFELRRVRLANGLPVAVEHAFYPPDIGVDLAGRDLRMAAVYRIFEDDLGFVVKEAKQSLSATLADAEHSRHLHVPPGSPLISVERLTTDMEERPLELLRAVYVPDRYRFSITLARRRAE